MRESVPPLPQYAFMAWCSVKKSARTLPLIQYLSDIALIQYLSDSASVLK
jgi:hypothetical protein